MDSAELAFSLLTEEDPLAVQELATRIEALNRERRSLTQELVDEGMRLAAEQVEEGQRLLFLAGEQFNPGVSGLVAGRLVERYSRPAVVVAVDGDVARASGRSVPDYHLAQALSECGELFLHYGGHPAAAGFVARTDDLDAIRQSLQATARERLRDATLEPRLRIDAEADFADMPGKTMDFIRRLAPYGQENPPPAFMARGVQATSRQRMGTQGQHMRLQLRQNGTAWEAVAFNQSWPEGVAERGRIDVVYTPELNTFNGRTRLQMRLLDLRAAE